MPLLHRVAFFIGFTYFFECKKEKAIISDCLVIPLGFEPRTHTLKVYCSTS